MKILRFLLAGLLLFVVVTVAAFVYLKWWQALIVVVVMIFSIVIGVKLILRNLGKILGDSMLKMFEIKSQVLRGATAEVHSVVATTAPADEPCADDEEGGDEEEPVEKEPANYYRIDATITPSPQQAGPMTHWDVDDLRLVDFDKPNLTLAQMSAEDAETTEGYPLCDLKIMEGDQFVNDEMGKHEGPKRITAVVAVPPHVRELKFMYYSEYFGRITLPPPMPQLG